MDNYRAGLGPAAAMNIAAGKKVVEPLDFFARPEPVAPAEIITGTPAELSNALGSLLMSLGSKNGN